MTPFILLMFDLLSLKTTVL